jgi:hypothetical protein
MEIENVLIRLRETTTEINRATADPRMKVVMEKSWLLQDRLLFSDMVIFPHAIYDAQTDLAVQPSARSKDSIRALGHVHLCGVLYVSWQTKESVDGRYLICLLYRDFLMMATAFRNEQTYTVQACISLAEIHIEEVDNGRGRPPKYDRKHRKYPNIRSRMH